MSERDKLIQECAQAALKAFHAVDNSIEPAHSRAARAIIALIERAHAILPLEPSNGEIKAMLDKFEWLFFCNEDVEDVRAALIAYHRREQT